MKLLEVNINLYLYKFAKPVHFYSFYNQEWLWLLLDKRFSPYTRWFRGTDHIINELVSASEKLKALQVSLKDRFLIIETYRDSLKPDAEVKCSFILVDCLLPELRSIPMIDWQMDLE